MKASDRPSRLPAAALLLLACAGGGLLAAAPASVGRQAVPIPSQAATTKFKSDAGAIFYTLKPEAAAVFESVSARLAAGNGPELNPDARRRATRWRVFRLAEPLANGSIVYLSFIESPETEVEYSLARLVRERLPAEAPEAFAALVRGLAAGVITANYKLVVDFRAPEVRGASAGAAAATAARVFTPRPGCPVATPPASAASAAPGQPPVAGYPLARCFTGDVGMLFYYVKGDRTQDFERLILRLKDALWKSNDPERRAQAVGWRVFRQAEPRGPNGVRTYVFLFDPVARGSDYAVPRMIGEAFPGEIQPLLSLYNTTNADGMSIVNGRLVAQWQ